MKSSTKTKMGTRQTPAHLTCSREESWAAARAGRVTARRREQSIELWEDGAPVARFTPPQVFLEAMAKLAPAPLKQLHALLAAAFAAGRREGRAAGERFVQAELRRLLGVGE
jgi:hypothetical protein